MTARARLSTASALCLGALVLAGTTGAAKSPPETLRGYLVSEMTPSKTSEVWTVTRPIVVPSKVRMWEPTSVTLQPTHCHRAFENTLGAMYACNGRVAHTEGIMKGGEIMTYVADYGAALWRENDATSATLLVFNSRMDNDQELLAKLKSKEFAALWMGNDAWTALAPGKLDVGLSSFAPKAARAAFEAAAWTSTKTTNSRPAAPPDQAVVWGELRDDQEVVIKKLDGETKWHQPLNGFAQVVSTTPGKHTLQLLVASRSVNYVEPKLEVELSAGHTYIVAYGIDDQPYLEDLGTSAHCERRKIGAFAKARHMPAWLACVP